MSIELQFVAERSLGSAAIGWFSAGHLSHVDARLGAWRLLGARTDCPIEGRAGVQIRPRDYAGFSRRIIAMIPATEKQRAAWHEFLHAQIGKPYDRLAILAFALNRNWREDDSWICSELQARALEVAGLVPPLYLACNKITPVALALLVSALPGVTIHEEPTR